MRRSSTILSVLLLAASWCRAAGGGGAAVEAPVVDSLAPEARSASLRYNCTGVSYDTLNVSGSETLTVAATGSYAILSRDSSGVASMTLAHGNSYTGYSSTGGLFVMVQSGLIPDEVGWVRFGTGISDGTNAVGNSSPWVRMAIRPCIQSSLHDEDGNGRADSMHVLLRGRIDASQALLHWKTASGAPDERAWEISSAFSAGPFGVRPADPSKWFELGARCSNCTVDFLDDQGNVLVESQLIDSMSPASLRRKEVGSFSWTRTGFVIHAASAETAVIHMWDLSGKRIAAISPISLHEGESRIAFPSSLSAGIYVADCTIDGLTYQSRFVKE